LEGRGAVHSDVWVKHASRAGRGFVLAAGPLHISVDFPWMVVDAHCPPATCCASAPLFAALWSAGFFKIERRVMSEAMDAMLKIGITERSALYARSPTV
jgi:hypothetical protein